MCYSKTNSEFRGARHAEERVILEIPSYDLTFATSGCGDWRPIANAITPVDVVPDGIWVVGEEITPGIYTAQGGDSCSWERLRSFSIYDGHYLDSIATGYGATRQVVEVLSTDEGFKTKGCGEWTPVN